MDEAHTPTDMNNNQSPIENQPQDTELANQEVGQEIQPQGQTTPLPQPTPNQPVKPKSNKVLYIGFIFLILALIATAGYFIYQNTKTPKPQEVKPIALPTQSQPTPTANPTKDWQTYTNQDSYYAIKYPSDWQITENINDPRLSSPYTSLTIGKFDIQASVNIIVEKTTTPDDFIPRETLVNSKTESIVLNGYSATKITSNETNLQIWVFINRDSKTYILNTWGTDEDQETINLILSTFKFVDTAPQTTDWQLYKNDKYGFQFKYPPGAELENERTDQLPYYARIQNYLSTDDVPGLKQGEFYIEVFVFDKSSGRNSGFSNCQEMVTNYKLIDNSIYIGDAINVGGEPGGKVKTLCYQTESVDIIVNGTENPNNTSTINYIFNTFKIY